MRLYFVVIIFGCIQIHLWAQHSLNKLPYPINDPYLDEICPILSHDEKILFFTRVADPKCEKTLIIDGKDIYLEYGTTDYETRLQSVYSEIASRRITDPISSGYNQDIWYTMINDSSVQGLFHPTYPINCILPNSICSRYAGDNNYIVINQFFPEGGIEKGFSLTTMSGQDFTFPVPIHIQGFDKVSSQVNLTSSENGDVLILSMESTPGNMDMYASFGGINQAYSPPIPLDDINTVYGETTPVLSRDGKTLYFASDRPNGFGGKDIWYAQRESESYLKWSKPKCLFPPVNSAADESHPHLRPDDHHFYFTSNRDGSSDIFEALLKRDTFSEDVWVTITLVSSETGKAIPGELHWGDAYSKMPMSGFFRSKDGICKYIFYKNKPVAFYAENRNLKSDTLVIDPQEWVNKGKKHIEVTMVLYPDGRIAQNVAPIQNTLKFDMSNDSLLTHYLRNIYFERATPNILSSSMSSIKKIGDILKKFPTLYIRIDGHTDNVGDKKDLRQLSNMRAEAIRNILLQEGIEPVRIGTRGYGDSRPIAPNDTEENKSKNRRVEITILAL
ncbi:MAG: OmpA family protein [Lewinellaceae bacterium]|nr:OmpA family protein [Lewinellaceae bacterium]